MANVRRLPGPIADVWEWQAAGLCRGRDSAQFFHPDGERGSSRNRREHLAKQLCLRCPVRAECAAHALATHEPYGVWGGFTESERLRLLALGWEDTADRYRHRVDIERLAARLRSGTTSAKRLPAHAPIAVPPPDPAPRIPSPTGATRTARPTGTRRMPSTPDSRVPAADSARQIPSAAARIPADNAARRATSAAGAPGNGRTVNPPVP